MCLLCWFSCSAANAHLFRHVVFYIFVCVKLSCCFCLSALCAHEFESESGVCRAKVAPTLHSRSRRCPNPNPNWQFQVGVCWNGKHHCAGTGVFFFLPLLCFSLRIEWLGVLRVCHVSCELYIHNYTKFSLLLVVARWYQYLTSAHTSGHAMFPAL